MSSSAAEVPRPSRRCPMPSSPPAIRWRDKPKRKGGVVITIVLAIVAIFWISPLVLLVITAVRPLSDFIANGPLSWPQTVHLENFSDAWGIGNFATTYRNSAILLLLKVPIGVLVSAMLGVRAGEAQDPVPHGRSCTRCSSA